MTNTFSSIEPALTPEERIECAKIKQEIFSELENTELNERVKKAVVLVLE